jgi:hypothetical protein
MSALDDIIARDSAPQQTSALDAIIARDSQVSAQASQPPATTPAKDSSLWGDFSRQLGLTARAGINGASGLPAMIGNALNAGVNGVFGTHLPPVSSALNYFENKAGLPQPQNATESIVQDVAGSMTGVNPSIAAGKVLAKTASPVASAIGKVMQSMPGMQVVGAGGAGAGSGIAREMGFGPGGQLTGALVGGGLGAVAPSAALATTRAAMDAPGAVVDAVRPFTNPEKYVGTQFAQTLGPDAAAVARNIRNAPEYVPGSLPTTAQVGQTPALVATEKSMANLSPEFKIAMANREADNNAARWQVLNDVGKTPEAIAAAQAAREAAASPLYDAAHANTANVGRGFINFARRPAVQQAMQHADQLARNEGVSIKWPTPDDRAIDGKALDYTARALGDMIDSAKRSGNNQQARALTEAQSYLKNWTEQYVPGVREAAQVYAQHSAPINTMEVGQQIANTLGTRAMNANGLPQIQLAPYRTALTQALKAQSHGVEEDALKSLQGVGQDLQRATVSSGLRSPGSDTAYNVSANGWLAKQLYGEDFGGAGTAARSVGALGAFLTGHPFLATGILTGGKRLGGMASDRLNAALSELLLNPQQMLPYLEAAKQGQKSASPLLAQGLRRNVNQGLLGMATSSGPKK